MIVASINSDIDQRKRKVCLIVQANMKEHRTWYFRGVDKDAACCFDFQPISNKLRDGQNE